MFHRTGRLSAVYTYIIYLPLTRIYTYTSKSLHHTAGYFAGSRSRDSTTIAALLLLILLLLLLFLCRFFFPLFFFLRVNDFYEKYIVVHTLCFNCYLYTHQCPVDSTQQIYIFFCFCEFLKNRKVLQPTVKRRIVAMTKANKIFFSKFVEKHSNRKIRNRIHCFLIFIIFKYIYSICVDRVSYIVRRTYVLRYISSYMWNGFGVFFLTFSII